MPGVWVCLKKSLKCCSSRKSGDVQDPVKDQIQRMNPGSGCSRSLSNLRNLLITNGDERVLQIPSISSSRSLESSNCLNALRFDDFVINDSNVYKCSWGDESNRMVQYSHSRRLSTASSADIVTGRSCSRRRVARSLDSDICGFGALACGRCLHKVKDLEAFEAHYLSKHSATKLVAGDFSRKVVELICNTGRSLKSDKAGGNILAILKVHNLQQTIAEFENHRELTKIRASKLPKKHPRCLADGNEFLGFHGTTLACSLGRTDSLGPCLSDQCGVCWILRHGFSSKTGPDGINGVLVTSTCSSALELIETDRRRSSKGVLKALVLCRVIAGRVHKPLKRSEQFSGSPAFNSVAMKMGPNSSIQELNLLSTEALLPCFVIIFKS